MVKNHIRLVANKLATTTPVMVTQHDGARSDVANPEFIRTGFTQEGKPSRDTWEAIETVPFQIIANETQNRVNEYGRPYIPASSFRGRLRNTGTLMLCEGMTGLIGEKALSVMLVGGEIKKKDKSKDAKSSDPKKFSLERLVNMHKGIPVLRVFGFNDPVFSKGFESFCDMLSEGHFYLTKSGITRKNPFIANPEIAQSINEAGWGSIDEQVQTDLIESQKRKDAKAEMDFAKSEWDAAKQEGTTTLVESTKKAYLKTKAAYEKIKNDTKVSSMQLHSHWAIPTGVNFKWSAVHYIEDDGVGFLAKTFEKWAINPTMGGNVGRGCGGNFDFEIEFQKFINGRYETIGVVSNGSITGTALKECVKEFEDRIPEYRAAILTFEEEDMVVPTSKKKVGDIESAEMKKARGRRKAPA